jgi:hypothetical protein
MFDPEMAFRSLENQTFTEGQLYRAVGKVRADNMQHLFAEIEVDDLLELIAQRGWIRRVSNRTYSVVIHPRM